MLLVLLVLSELSKSSRDYNDQKEYVTTTSEKESDLNHLLIIFIYFLKKTVIKYGNTVNQFHKESFHPCISVKTMADL